MTISRAAIAWSAVCAVIMLIAVAASLLIDAVNDRGVRDAPLARAECAQLAGGTHFEFEWRFGLRPGWVCGWTSSDTTEGGGAYIDWDAYASR